MRRFVTRNVERRLREVVRNVREWGDGLRPTFWRVLPWVVLGATSFWLGGCVELALGCRAHAAACGRARPLRGRARRGGCSPGYGRGPRPSAAGTPRAARA